MSVGLGCECVGGRGGVIMIREEGGRQGRGKGRVVAAECWLCISDTLELDFFIHSLTYTTHYTLTVH